MIDRFAALAAEEGSDCWFTRGVEDFITRDFSCPHCQGKSFSKGADILDVWFDSGVSSQAVLKKREELAYPADLYLEGSDQHRGWFQSSLIPAICIDSKAPFKSVLTHGHVVDAQGRKMSKSLGNVIAPQDIIKDSGADIVRLWVASSDYNEDIRISPEILKRLTEAYRKVRNTARFILSNLYDFDPDQHRAKDKDLRRIDRWILERLDTAAETVSNAYENFEFYKAYKGIYDFCNEDLSMYYLDMVKGRLYTSAADSPDRRAAQSVIYDILNCLVRLLAPILVFTAEEIWQALPRSKNDKATPSVHLAEWPKLKAQSAESDLNMAIEIIPDVAKALEEKRAAGLIGSSFDAKINLLTNNEIRYNYLFGLKDDLSEIFKVSQVDITKQAKPDAGLKRPQNYPEIAIEVIKAEGQKCVRCWNYSISVGSNSVHHLICAKCLAAIGGQ